MSKQHVSFGAEGRTQLTRNIRATKAANMNKRRQLAPEVAAIMKSHKVGKAEAKSILAAAQAMQSRKAEQRKTEDMVTLSQQHAARMERKAYKVERAERERKARVAEFLNK